MNAKILWTKEIEVPEYKPFIAMLEHRRFHPAVIDPFEVNREDAVAITERRFQAKEVNYSENGSINHKYFIYVDEQADKYIQACLNTAMMPIQFAYHNASTLIEKYENLWFMKLYLRLMKLFSRE